jgi:hypothetical protein
VIPSKALAPLYSEPRLPYGDPSASWNSPRPWCLSCINLYLTVFVTGLAIQQGWILLAPQYASLAILSDPVIIFISGALYGLEFFADKIPWVDSLWDSVHTIIRPIGAAFLGLHALGDASPAFDVIIALCAGGAGLATHTLKSTTRLVANGSPEPFSNIGLSILEDITVLGGLAMVHFHPAIMLVVVLLTTSLVIVAVPRLFRVIRVKAWLIWKKLNSLCDTSAQKTAEANLPATLPPDADVLLHNSIGTDVTPEWAIPCINTGSKKLSGNLFGFLVALKGEHDKLHFITKEVWRKTKATENFEIKGYRVQHETKLLSENLVLYSVNGQPKRTFIFDRSRRGIVSRLSSEIAERISKSATA